MEQMIMGKYVCSLPLSNFQFYAKKTGTRYLAELLFTNSCNIKLQAQAKQESSCENLNTAPGTDAKCHGFIISFTAFLQI